jgi:hypothetical protein
MYTPTMHSQPLSSLYLGLKAISATTYMLSNLSISFYMFLILNYSFLTFT